MPWFGLIKIRWGYGKNMPSILPGTYLYPVQMSAFGELFMDTNDVAKSRPNMRQLQTFKLQHYCFYSDSLIIFITKKLKKFNAKVNN